MSDRNNIILFYSRDNRAGATAVINSSGGLDELREIPAGSFGLWTHIVSDGSRILFYSRDNRAGATAVINSSGGLDELREIPAGSFGLWTHIVC